MSRLRLALGLSLVILLGAGAAVGYRAYLAHQEAQQALLRRQAAWANLVRILEEEITRFQGEVAVVIEDLEREWPFAHQATEPFPAASLVKLPIMAAVLQALAEGRIDPHERLTLRKTDWVSGSGVLKDKAPGSRWTIGQLLDFMITESDNTATNLLITRMGLEAINRYVEQAGLRQTRLVRKMMDFSRRDQGVENYTTAADIAALLTMLYHHELVNASTSEHALDLLKRQTRNDRIPAELPPGTVVAHKTGLERGLCHDAGIVFTERGDFLIVVLTQSQAPSPVAKAFIADLTRQAYQYLLEASALRHEVPAGRGRM